MTITKTRNIEALLADMAQGNERAFRLLYETLGNWVYSIALRILRDPQIAEDAVQETFVKLWRTAGRYDVARGSAKAWIGVIARNCALDMGRRRLPASDSSDTTLELLEANAIEPPDPKLGKCLGQLPDDQARAIVTMYTYGFSHSELSEQLGLPLGTIKSWVRRGTQALKVCMEK